MNAIIKEISTEFSKGNFKATYTGMSDDIVWNLVGSAKIQGKQEVISYCDKMLKEMDGSILSNTNYIMSDNAAAVQGYCDYTKENNTKSRIEYCDVYRFAEDKLQEITSYCVEMDLQ